MMELPLILLTYIEFHANRNGDPDHANRIGVE